MLFQLNVNSVFTFADLKFLENNGVPRVKFTKQVIQIGIALQI